VGSRHAVPGERASEGPRRELRALVGDGVSRRTEAARGGGEQAGDVPAAGFGDEDPRGERHS
jgi:hypothetical protein